MSHYTASKRRDPGRGKYAVIFRHPVRLDPVTGRPGRRVRRGLGTSDETEADTLVLQLNELLSTEQFWSYSARGTADGRFDPRVVSTFFDGMEPAALTPSAVLREQVLPLPDARQGYRRVLLLGTTGAGKTTVVRQLLGTDPVRHRFPSTSTAKTTVADTEIIVAEGQFSGVVTFFPRDEVVDHLADCASKASLVALRGASDTEIRTALLDHDNQRFRFSYVLGRQRQSAAMSSQQNLLEDARDSPEIPGDDLDDLDDLRELDAHVAEARSPRFDAEPEGLVGIDLAVTTAIVDDAVRTLKVLVVEHGATASAQLNVSSEDDERVMREILDEELDRILRADERFNVVVDTLLDEIEKRFDAIPVGVIVKGRQGWPTKWEFQTDNRIEFLRAVNRFTSNYAPQFGHLLSPLVDGIRVRGPFYPDWQQDHPKLVLIDGEGLGHTPKSASSLPTAVAKAIEEADAVLLVDSATQPMQAAPASAIRSMLTSGDTDKLIFCFTHFDEVVGDNLQTPSDRARHVLASVENVLASVREDFGPRSERALRRRLDTSRVFLAGIDKTLDPESGDGHQSIRQFQRLLVMIDRVTDRPDLGRARPVYDKANLVLAITAAATSYHRRWRAILGIDTVSGVEKEHWTRVKALNRRYAEGTSDQYDTLRPAADLREHLKEEIYRTLETPLRWSGERPTDDIVVSAVIDEFAQSIARKLAPPIRERLSMRAQRSWQEAYALNGIGSTFRRSRRISDDILGRNVPVPGAAPSPDRNDFLHAIILAVDEAAREVRCDLV